MIPPHASLTICPCGVERAEEVHRLTQAAFRSYWDLDPPSGARWESVMRVIDDLSAGGGAVAEQTGSAVGCLRWKVTAEGYFHVRRVAIEPEVQRRGIGRALMGWAEAEAQRRGCTAVSAGVLVAVPGNLAFYRRLGYRVSGERRHEGYERTTWLAVQKVLIKESAVSTR